MQVLHFPYEEVSEFAQRDLAYINEQPKLRSFYQYEPAIDSFQQVIQDKSTANTDRQVLVDVLKAQYSDFEPTDTTIQRIESLLDGNTFTLVTAHQPSLFTGPLYFIYKIFSVINLAEQLNEKYTDYNIVPLFITGGEDHDFEEINHAHIFGKTLEWANEESGAVGRMKTSTLQPTLSQLKEILGESSSAVALCTTIENAFTKFDSYGAATRYLVHCLFEKYGLVVIGMDEPKFKQRFIPYIKEEIFDQPSQALIQATQEELAAQGFDSQAHPRAINFFYLHDQLRSRIVLEDDVYKVLDSNFVFTRAELEAEIEAHPERFSPNVVMRPIYQETILPNLAYIGGGGELAYWQERKSQFAHFGVNFPMLIRRNSALWIDKGNAKRLEKVGLAVEDLFEDTHSLVKAYVKENSEQELSLNHEKLKTQQIFEGIVEKALAIDKGLKKTVLSEQAKMLNAIGVLEGKLLRAEKNRHDVALNQIRSLKERLFPNGLQERHTNFMEFYLKYGDDFFNTLKAYLHPLDKEFLVFLDRE
ncbi:MAG: bacillithiol biosynthesis cysteine-adding enzyme BshC [Bacteroidota bacterium]